MKWDKDQRRRSNKARKSTFCLKEAKRMNYKFLKPMNLIFINTMSTFAQNTRENILERFPLLLIWKERQQLKLLTSLQLHIWREKTLKKFEMNSLKYTIISKRGSKTIKMLILNFEDQW